MGVYLGDASIDDIHGGTGTSAKVYLGSTQVWPTITYPYVLTNTNVSDADIPAGATGVWVNLIGGGQAGSKGGRTVSSANTGSASGGTRGGGAAAIPRVFIKREDLPGTKWSMIRGVGGSDGEGENGTASVFTCGTVTLSAGGGTSGGGTATVTGLTGVVTRAGAGSGGATGAGAAGGNGGGASWTGDNTPTGSPGQNGGTVTSDGVMGTQLAGNGGRGGNGYGSGVATHIASGGGGGGGGGGYTGGNGANGVSSSGGLGGAGGAGFCQVEWVDYSRSFALAVTPGLGMEASEQYARGFALAVTPALGFQPADFQVGYALSVTPAVGMTATASTSTAAFGLSVASSLEFGGAGASTAGFGLAATPDLGMAAAFPAMTPVVTTFTANATYDIPWWATVIEIILLGGGGAGNRGGAGFANGGGGGEGEFQTVTLVRGVDIPWSTTQITVVVGAVKPGPGVNDPDYQNGNPSSAVATGWGGIVAAGGVGGKGQGSQQNGYGGGSVTLNGETMTRGAGGTGNAGAGQAPGAGGAGGNGVLLGKSAGGAGARGEVRIKARQ